jgi:hypothetical protein
MIKILQDGTDDFFERLRPLVRALSPVALSAQK